MAETGGGVRTPGSPRPAPPLVAKASQRARLILMCFSTRDPAVLMIAFNTYVRPILEYATVVLSPFWMQDIGKLEVVQKGLLRDCMVCRNYNMKPE